jgi:hypothetical protein
VGSDHRGDQEERRDGKSARYPEPGSPYDRISITLPIALTAIFEPLPTACQTQQSVLDNRFPFPDLLSPSAWIRPQSDYAKGWAPSLTSP